MADAVARCHTAGIRILVVTGDHGLTAAAVARRVGIGGTNPRVITGAELEAMPEPGLDRLLREGEELIFARTSPEAKLRIADALRAEGHVVAMTGDGVNDAPALRRADIGVAMGISGTDVARESATMILTDDNFASIVGAVEEGRRVYANIRKFILYIFAHAPAEVVPFLAFAASGGACRCPSPRCRSSRSTSGRRRCPRSGWAATRPRPASWSGRRVAATSRSSIAACWCGPGPASDSAVLVMGGFLYVLLRAGWHPGDDVGTGSPLHHAYIQATTMSFLGIVSCQLGTAFAARTDRGSLRSIGFFSNRLLLWGIAFELAFAAAVIYVPALQAVFGTAALPLEAVLFTVPFPLIVGRRRAGSQSIASSTAVTSLSTGWSERRITWRSGGTSSRGSRSASCRVRISRVASEVRPGCCARVRSRRSSTAAGARHLDVHGAIGRIPELLAEGIAHPAAVEGRRRSPSRRSHRRAGRAPGR